MIKSLSEKWDVVKLESILEKIANGANVKQVDESVGLPVSRIETIWNETIDTTRVKYVIDPPQELINKYALKANDILFSHINSDSHLGKTAIYKGHPEILIHGINLLLIRLKESVNASFINYQFNYKRKRGDFIAIAQKSVNQSSINQAKLKNIELVLPALPIQQAIVAKLGALFSELDKGIEQLKTAQQQLRTYRQAVLKAAFEGRLTGEQGKDGELPEGWKWSTIKDVAEVGTGATPLKSNPAFYNGSINWVTSGELNDPYIKTATEFITEKAVKETNCRIYPKGTLVVAMYGEGKTRGKCAELAIEAATNQAIAAIHFTNHDESIKPYLKYFLQKNYDDIRRQSSGGVQPNLNLGIIKRLKFPYAPKPEQFKIIPEIESRLSAADKMEEAISQGLQQAEALRQSILKKAFDGELLNL